MDLPRLLAAGARLAARHCARAPGARALPPPALPPHGPHLVWRNWIFATPQLRRLHVELFSARQQFAVLHVCAMPNTHSANPIFGFDVVCGKTVPSGLFLDISPTTQAPPTPSLTQLIGGRAPADFGTVRPLPQWGSIFSPDFICVRPDNEAALRAGVLAGLHALAGYLNSIGHAPSDAGRAGQRVYCQAQRANPHTRRMLAGFVGAAEADCFIGDVLFPDPD